MAIVVAILFLLGISTLFLRVAIPRASAATLTTLRWTPPAFFGLFALLGLLAFGSAGHLAARARSAVVTTKAALARQPPAVEIIAEAKISSSMPEGTNGWVVSESVGAPTQAFPELRVSFPDGELATKGTDYVGAYWSRDGTRASPSHYYLKRGDAVTLFGRPSSEGLRVSEVHGGHRGEQLKQAAWARQLRQMIAGSASAGSAILIPILLWISLRRRRRALGAAER